MSTCNHGNTAPDAVLDAIHISQAGQREGVEIWRHKCCECAFERGYQIGREQTTTPAGTAFCKETKQSGPIDLFDGLPKSQGRTGRHKCAICAFHEGFKRGRALAAPAQSG